jgi:hypothetical protein
MLTTHPHLLPKFSMSRSYTPLTSSATMACSGITLPLPYYELFDCVLNGTPCSMKVANPLKMWQSSNIWEQRQQIKIACTKNTECRLNSGNTCYYALQKLLSYFLLPKHTTIKIHKIVILPVIRYERKTWSLALREHIEGPWKLDAENIWT